MTPGYLEAAARFARLHPTAPPFLPPTRAEGESDREFDKRTAKALVEYQISVLRSEDRGR